ncbi:hypothetical protein EH165_13465 [Nakamurella antarctica]|uniref:Uncharacterized protein n=1 Tax=Nakamurella antarctica TaxID=1902245 RepID=A0A3G8ZQC9_9ACTN|nr:hypothetical protein [Nakamurella antarctica]AZI59005.1 hypothetical protein EH165_13465 [Nakamurella antarctica]
MRAASGFVGARVRVGGMRGVLAGVIAAALVVSAVAPAQAFPIPVVDYAGIAAQAVKERTAAAGVVTLAKVRAAAAANIRSAPLIRLAPTPLAPVLLVRILQPSAVPVALAQAVWVGMLLLVPVGSPRGLVTWCLLMRWVRRSFLVVRKPQVCWPLMLRSYR